MFKELDIVVIFTSSVLGLKHSTMVDICYGPKKMEYFPLCSPFLLFCNECGIHANQSYERSIQFTCIHADTPRMCRASHILNNVRVIHFTTFFSFLR